MFSLSKYVERFCSVADKTPIVSQKGHAILNAKANEGVCHAQTNEANYLDKQEA